MDPSEVIKELLKEHEKLREELREIFKNVEKLKRLEKDQFLSNIHSVILIFYRCNVICSKFDTHEEIEEFEVLPHLKDESMKQRLLNDHTKMLELREKVAERLRAFRLRKIEFKELVKDLMKLLMEMEGILDRHIKVENEEFQKLM